MWLIVAIVVAVIVAIILKGDDKKPPIDRPKNVTGVSIRLENDT